MTIYISKRANIESRSLKPKGRERETTHVYKRGETEIWLGVMKSAG